MKILNLYSGIGGNRKLWGDEHDVTAVESEEYIAQAYRKLFPRDAVIVGDAHQYLLDHFKEFDFIWSSPPCPSHGQYRYNVGVLAKGYKPLFPDMKLYEEIIFLKHYFAGRWLVENVKPYYTPLISPTTVMQRHLFWSNFPIPVREFEAKHIRSKNKISDYDYLGVDEPMKNKRQVMRNAVDPEIGRHVLQAAELLTSAA
jgi:DNA (cytosine-5)-methyltransferase 1